MKCRCEWDNTRMPYEFVKERPNYSDLSSGRVFYSLPGHPAFPIRLASEIFQRCVKLRQADGKAKRFNLYDPCCGSAYLVSMLAYLHAEDLAEVYASDIDPKAVEAARRNLSLLHPDGIARRREELEDLWARFGKDSHKAALISAENIATRVGAIALAGGLKTCAFQADALTGKGIRPNLPGRVDLVITDIPYGQHSNWLSQSGIEDALKHFTLVLADVLSPGDLAVIISDKGQKIPRDGWMRREHFHLGLRRIEILQRR